LVLYLYKKLWCDLIDKEILMAVLPMVNEVPDGQLVLREAAGRLKDKGINIKPAQLEEAGQKNTKLYFENNNDQVMVQINPNFSKIKITTYLRNDDCKFDGTVEEIIDTGLNPNDGNINIDTLTNDELPDSID